VKDGKAVEFKFVRLVQDKSAGAIHSVALPSGQAGGASH
jgi:hypothetical protein